MKITILTDKISWMNRHLHILIEKLEKKNHQVSIVNNASDIPDGDICLFLGFYKIIAKEFLKRSKNNVVVHASDLPKGKGWAPLTWQILEGNNTIPVCLFEAIEEMDAGDIYLRSYINLDGTELSDEIREKQALNAFEMCLEFIDKYPQILDNAEKQIGEETIYHKRTPQSSELDINKTIAEQFNLLRIADNKDYPAFFNYKKQKYILKIEKCTKN